MAVFMLDSGAYGAWSRGEAIDIDHYIAYIKANCEHLDHYVALDVIPGAFGVTPTPAEVERSAAQSWENLLYMEEQGLNPIPVFHMHEQFKWLQKMREHCPYIGISPANDVNTDKKRVWLDRVFDAICDDKGVPTVQTHAFGVTAIPLLIRYPWYSADSVTWITFSGRGGILIPKWGHFSKTWMYNETPWACHVSEPHKDVTTADLARTTAWRRNPAQLAHCKQWLEFAGSSLEYAETDYLERARLCVFFFQEFERNFVPQPFRRVKQHLFGDL